MFQNGHLYVFFPYFHICFSTFTTFIIVNKEKILFWCLFITYTIITFYHSILSGRVPNNDEAHAWLIAEHFNIFQILEIMNNEGHFLLWYLIIIPFAKFNLLQPVYMQFINWLFCLGAIYLLWTKSPFSTSLKIAITFSCPFLHVYPIYARCYSIGIFFLFLSASLYLHFQP